MTLLILGLILFIGVHSARIVADDWRTAQIARLGLNGWKAIYSIASIIGFILIVYGYGLARAQPIVLWSPPAWTRHLAMLFVLLSFILIAAAYVPRNHIKAKLGHPMVGGVKVWAFAHLLANGNLADVILFGSFLAWAILNFLAARRRDRANGTTYPAGTMKGDVITLVAGSVVWVVFLLWLHTWLIGVRPY